jgi:hypothetical protein
MDSPATGLTGAGPMSRAPLIAIEHPGPAPDITAAGKPKLSWFARLTLWRRIWRGPVALVLAVGPAAMAFGVEMPPIGRMLLLLVAVVIFALVRWALRGSQDVARFQMREHEARKLWQSALAQWDAQAGPRRFDAKRAELAKLEDWLRTAAGQPEQRIRIETAIRRAFGELQLIANQIQVARMTLRRNAEEIYERLLQAELDLKTMSKKR